MWDFLDKIGILTGIAGSVFSLLIWIKLRAEEKFKEQRIRIQLKVDAPDNRIIILPYEIERKYLTRSELQGLLGILPMNDKKARYSLDFLNTQAFFNRLKAAQDDKFIESIEIKCSCEELQQFDFDKMKKQCAVIE